MDAESLLRLTKKRRSWRAPHE